MSDLLNVVERSQDNLLLARSYIARESPRRRGRDPTAPPRRARAIPAQRRALRMR
jgi:hypothetical protein